MVAIIAGLLGAIGSICSNSMRFEGKPVITIECGNGAVGREIET
jgi:hypothetical protein